MKINMKTNKLTFYRRSGAALLIGTAALSLTACSTNLPNNNAMPQEQRSKIDEASDATLKRLYEAVPGSREYVERAHGVLVFPEAVSGGFIVGVEHGKGVLRTGGQHAGYYSISAGSVGFQAGAQSRAIVILFMTPEALNDFRNSTGWTSGVDATVAVATVGANRKSAINVTYRSGVTFVLSKYSL